MELPTALSDLDGTLTDPKVGIIRSVQHALQHFGVPASDLDSLTAYIGPPLEDSFEVLAGFSGAQAVEAVRVYRERFTDIGIFENVVYDGITDALDALRADGWVLAVATSKPTVFAERILGHFALRDRFAAVAGSELDGSRRHKRDVIAYALELLGRDPDPDVVMVGDREHDIRGAQAWGLRTVGVTWGYGTEQELLQSGADCLVDEIPALAEAVGSMPEQRARRLRRGSGGWPRRVRFGTSPAAT
jgi:phosphoglycolate phosphatase